MTLKPTVSIIIPTYNRERYIATTLDSVIGQSSSDWECIIVDDGSTDGTIDLIQTYLAKDNRIRFYQRPDDMASGGNGARNYGYEHSKGNYLIFLDSDDILSPTAVEKRITQLASSDCDMLINKTAVFNEKPGDSDLMWNSIDANSSNDHLLIRFFNLDMPWQTNGVTWSRSFFEACGKWNETLKAWQDWEIHCRALLKQPKLNIQTTEPDNYYRYMTASGIASQFESERYLNASENAILTIADNLSRAQVSQERTNAFNKLILRRFVIERIKNGFKLRPLSTLFKSILFRNLDRSQYLKVYILFLLSRSGKLKQYLVKDQFDRLVAELKVPSTHLKKTP